MRLKLKHETVNDFLQSPSEKTWKVPRSNIKIVHGSDKSWCIASHFPSYISFHTSEFCCFTTKFWSTEIPDWHESFINSLLTPYFWWGSGSSFKGWDQDRILVKNGPGYSIQSSTHLVSLEEGDRKVIPSVEDAVENAVEGAVEVAVEAVVEAAAEAVVEAAVEAVSDGWAAVDSSLKGDSSWMWMTQLASFSSLEYIKAWQRRQIL